MKIGTMFAGEVDADSSGQCVQTMFLLIGLPVIPLQSWYVIRSTGHGVEGFHIEPHAKSIALGYARFWLILPAILFIVGWIEPGYGNSPAPYILGLGATIAAWVAITFFVGNGSATEKRQRRLLHEATGLACPPEIMPFETRDRVFVKLKERWVAVSMSETPWKEQAKTDPNVVPLAYSLGRYAKIAATTDFQELDAEAWALVSVPA
jgi:hypothetical protein